MSNFFLSFSVLIFSGLQKQLPISESYKTEY